MNFVLKEKDIVMLADKHNYLVHTLFEYNGEGYLYLVRAMDIKKENPVIFFAKEKVVDNKLYLDVIKDSELIKKLSNKIQSN